MRGISALHTPDACSECLCARQELLGHLPTHPAPAQLPPARAVDGRSCFCSWGGIFLPIPKSAVTCTSASFCRAQPCLSAGKAERCWCQRSHPAVVDGGAHKSCRCACRAWGGFGQRSSQPAALPPPRHSKPSCPLPALHSVIPGFSPGLGKGLWHWQGFGTGHYRL